MHPEIIRNAAILCEDSEIGYHVNTPIDFVCLVEIIGKAEEPFRDRLIEMIRRVRLRIRLVNLFPVSGGNNPVSKIVAVDSFDDPSLPQA